AAIVGGEADRSVFDVLEVPDWRSHDAAVDARYGGFREEDLYPDARRSVERLQAMGLKVAILANQPVARHPQLLALGFRPDVIAMSAELGLEKPDPAFFRRGLELMGDPDPARVAYVGDRIDRDVAPSRAAGLRPVWIRRGPWGRLKVDRGHDAAMVVESLDEFVARVGEL
ncbi:MAG TPA: HAD-IA family hydrolase, partial [Candidatus Saccharimonadales bacterium]|nr:HAD-IA family hydrolase [Candidatus Saccharimonadales bacterium]